MMWWLPLILPTTNPASPARLPPGCPALREPAASGNVADGDRQLVRNPEFREPAVQRLAEVSDGVFRGLPLAVGAAPGQRCMSRPPAGLILLNGVRHVHNTVHKENGTCGSSGRRPCPCGQPDP